MNDLVFFMINILILMNYQKFFFKSHSFRPYFKYAFLFIPYYIAPRSIKLQALSSTEVIKGEYENKIRIFSPIEKRYLIFGKIKSSEDSMDSIGFFESLLPFHNLETRSREEINSLLSSKGKDFFDLFTQVVDVNKDNNISFEEYLIFCHFISSKCISCK